MFYLEENELYTRDLQVVCIYRDVNTNEERLIFYCKILKKRKRNNARLFKKFNLRV